MYRSERENARRLSFERETSVRQHPTMTNSRAFIAGLLSLSLMVGGTVAWCKRHRGRHCPAGWRLWGDSCYKVTEQRFADWSKAKQECVDMGAVMAAPQSDQETAFFQTLKDSPQFWIDCMYLSDLGMFTSYFFPFSPLIF